MRPKLSTSGIATIAETEDKPGPAGTRSRSPRLSRGLKRTLTAIGLVICLFAAGLAAILWRILPPQDDVLTIAGVVDPVGVAFDSNDIPFIRAASDTDAAAALGYIHARDRFFQMDLMRRAAGGTLAALLGPAALPNDREMRTLGTRASAEADVADLSPQARAMLQAYANGVNAWLAKRGRFTAPEYLVLGKPEPWTIVDSLLWGKMMGLWLSGNWQAELARLALSGTMPRAQIDSLWPAAAPGRQPDQAAAAPPGAAKAAQQALTWLRHFPQPFTQPAQASNEWAAAGTHTNTGRPLLAGDPHLAFGFPGIWYLARIDTPSGLLAGATVPGVPFLVIGHNQHVAWTFTTTGADTEDVFIEHVTADGTQYETPDGPKPFGHRREVIHVRGRPDVVLDVRTTRHGPVIGQGPDAHTVLTVEMASLAPHDTAADGLLALDNARWVSDAGLAAQKITSPVQNLMAADTAGNIAFYTTGRVPIRRSGDGAWPEDGADGRHDWTGWAAGSALPHDVNPASGVLLNANEPTVGRDFPVMISRDAFGGWRAARIRQLLDAQPLDSLESFAAMQMDVVSDYARRLLPVLNAVMVPKDDPAAPAAALLHGWDGRMAAHAPQPLIFNAWMEAFGDRVLKANGVPPDSGAVLRDSFVMSLLVPAGGEGKAAAVWCGGDCRPYLRPALDDAMAKLRPLWGARYARWRWDRAHKALFAHPIVSRLPIIGGLGDARVPVPGDATTIDAEAPGFGPGREEFTAVHGPEFRGVYDIANLDRSLFVIAPGQSGDLLDQHAFDFLQRWRTGGMVQLGPEPNVVSRQIRIMPKSKP
ncbi:MAG TPA: penicillin acylase family protein [Acidisoma sp.]|uniref:penicillin acylase family protein n=1 Tax=Acidisoma sp. TaxID=1872115 RepID=UPI002D0BA35E|nr:penicillin acylase family protein [Acidisoma sp.]HTI03093.1 penicillin acylase family protein [Acidisoma sp.]